LGNQPDEEEQLREIGRIAVRFGGLAWLTVLLLQFLTTREPGIGRILFAGDSLDSLLTRAERLLPYRVSGTLLEDARSWTGRVRKAKDQRNRMLHGYWLGQQEAEEAASMMVILKRGEMSIELVKHSEVQEIGDTIDSLADEGVKIVHRVQEAIWPDLFDDDSG
jgi:hypothetical protein